MKEEVVEKIVSLITAAIALVAALAWNDAIQALVKEMFGKAETVPAMFGYAFTITIIAVVITIHLGKLTEKQKSKKK